MPELPEVETVRRGIEPLVVNQTIKVAICRVPKLRWQLDPSLSSVLSGQTIKSVKRRAKYLLLQMDRGTLVIHLGMTGILRLVNAGVELRKHDHVDIIFANNQCLRLNDSRRFGAVLYVDGDIVNHPLFKSLGPEPLTESFNSNYLYKRSRNCKSPIKNFLMNQKVVVGVGNIYASEVLFRSGIVPLRAAGTVSKVRFDKLIAEIKSVLAEAIEQGGTTIRDFADSDGKPGYFKQKLKVYGREELPCVDCFNPIRRIRLGGRSTFYCPNCQK